jgi:hypothetical protein
MLLPSASLGKTAKQVTVLVKIDNQVDHIITCHVGELSAFSINKSTCQVIRVLSITCGTFSCRIRPRNSGSVRSIDKRSSVVFIASVSVSSWAVVLDST